MNFWGKLRCSHWWIWMSFLFSADPNNLVLCFGLWRLFLRCGEWFSGTKGGRQFYADFCALFCGSRWNFKALCDVLIDGAEVFYSFIGRMPLASKNDRKGKVFTFRSRWLLPNHQAFQVCPVTRVFGIFFIVLSVALSVGAAREKPLDLERVITKSKVQYGTEDGSRPWSDD